MSDKRQLFDDWAPRYDRQVATDAFPLVGYAETLDRLVQMAEIGAGQRVLDVGVGTGNLIQRITAPDCEIWGVDFSQAMLDQARTKVPNAHLVCADLLDGWPTEIMGSFGWILSAYVFHEFEPEAKLRLIAELDKHLVNGGCLLIGDIAFETVEDLSRAREEYAEWWEEEDYWIAERDLPALTDRGYDASFRKTSFCGGVFTIEPRNSSENQEQVRNSSA